MDTATETSHPDARGLGLDELLASNLRLVALGAVPAVLGFLILAAVDLDVRKRADMWLVVCGIAGAGALVHRLAQRESKWAAPTLIGSLLANLLLVFVLFPGTPMIFSLALVSIASGLFLDGVACAGASLLTGVLAVVFTLQPAGPWPASDVGPLLAQIGAGGFLAWLGGRTVRAALDWYSSSYQQALDQTEVLRDHRAELVRLSQQLTIAVNRLEEANYQLDRARREADAARKLKSEFATAISHELRTPLNLIIGFSEMLEREAQGGAGALTPACLHGDLEAIHRNACHIANLINDVLDLGQIEANRFALQKQLVSLHAIAEAAVEAVQGLFVEAAVPLRTRLGNELPLVQADPVRIRQVLINLLANAARHTDMGLVEVSAERDGNQILVSVSDTGVGIPPEDLPWVFEEFRQAGHPRRRRGGSGFGLAVARHFVELHGGNIWVESTVGVGSVFHFTIPLQGQVVSVAGTPNRGYGLATSVPHPDRVLMVARHDDEPFRLFRSYLDGYDVGAVPTLDEAGRVAQDDGARALILTETPSPETVPQIAVRLPRLAALPVLTCSIRMPRRLSFDPKRTEYLVKPVRRDALAAALRRMAKRMRSVLVVDDDADFRGLLARMIRQEFRRCRVLQAADGARALDVMRAASVDAVLLDLLMPGLDGYDVLAARCADPILGTIPVVVISAYGTEDETITADSLTIGRVGGLTMAELMRCARACLDALLVPTDRTEPAPPGAPTG